MINPKHPYHHQHQTINPIPPTQTCNCPPHPPLHPPVIPHPPLHPPVMPPPQYRGPPPMRRPETFLEACCAAMCCCWLWEGCCWNWSYPCWFCWCY